MKNTISYTLFSQCQQQWLLQPWAFWWEGPALQNNLLLWLDLSKREEKENIVNYMAMQLIPAITVGVWIMRWLLLAINESHYFLHLQRRAFRLPLSQPRSSLSLQPGLLHPRRNTFRPQHPLASELYPRPCTFSGRGHLLNSSVRSSVNM